jgi:hypothetical protein
MPRLAAHRNQRVSAARRHRPVVGTTRVSHPQIGEPIRHHPALRHTDDIDAGWIDVDKVLGVGEHGT